jgi:hypothetical protein
MAKPRRLRLHFHEFEIPYKQRTLFDRVKLLFRLIPHCIKVIKFQPYISLEDAIDGGFKPFYIISIAKLKFGKEARDE